MQKQWTPDEDSQLEKLLREGLSASQIGERLGVSRNAVIGRVHRNKALSAIGFERGTPHHKQKPRAPRVPNVRAVNRQRPFKTAPMPKLDPIKMTNIDRLRFDEMRSREKITLVDLKHDECKFAVNDPAPGGVFFFCGEVLYNDRANVQSCYCKHHYQRSISSGTFSERTAVGDLLRAA